MALKLLGPQWQAVQATCEELGLDFTGHVSMLGQRLTEMENQQAAMLEQFQADLGPEIWPCVGHALGVNHTIENVRRGLMAMMNAGQMGPELAASIANLFSAISNATNTFVNATLTSLLGETVAGFDKETVGRKITGPFNQVMEQKRAIFDMIGDANNRLQVEIMAGLRAKADAAMKGEAPNPPAANDETTLH